MCTYCQGLRGGLPRERFSPQAGSSRASHGHPAAAIDPFLPVAASTKRSSLGRLHVHMSSDAAATHGPCMVLLMFALAD